MSNIVSLGCKIAKLHHEYAHFHELLFGAASFRIAISLLTGRTEKMYRESAAGLQALHEQLAQLAAEVPDALPGGAPHQTQLLRNSLAEYVAALDKAINDLGAIYDRLLTDEEAYRFTPPAGQSAFNQDKIRYDRELLELENIGTRLNKLFARY